MPIYDYQCRKCKNKFELVVLKTTVVACPKCASTSLEQLLSASFAVSTESGRQANIQSARRRFTNSKDTKDKKVHEAEEIREHSHGDH